MVAVFALAATWSVRMGYADYQARQQTIEATEAAVRWMPDDADYRFRLAALRGDAGGAGSIEQLQRAVELNPWDARAWIELGLRREAEPNLNEAERCLLQAAEADRLYVPRWTLANFYFRHGNLAEFQHWAKAAAATVYGDASALFRLCEKVWDDDLIDRLEIRRPDVRADYLNHLLSDGRLELIMPAARKLLDSGRQSDVPILMSACDRLLERENAPDALEIWNALARARRIPFAVLEPRRGSILTDSRFEATSTPNGFAWKTLAPVGVTASVEDSGGLRLTFSGSEPEQCELLAQLVPVEEQTDYELKWLFRTSEIAANTGLEWRVTDTAGRNLFGDSESLSSDEQQWKAMRFRTPAGCRLARLGLGYSRKPGAARIAGFLVLREVRMSVVGK
jgi:tetratricopeptide (TPR) repeat protein